MAAHRGDDKGRSAGRPELFKYGAHDFREMRNTPAADTDGDIGTGLEATTKLAELPFDRRRNIQWRRLGKLLLYSEQAW